MCQLHTLFIQTKLCTAFVISFFSKNAIAFRISVLSTEKKHSDAIFLFDDRTKHSLSIKQYLENTNVGLSEKIEINLAHK